MDKEEIKLLLARYEAGQATPEEQALLENWFYSQRRELPSPKEMRADLDEVWSRVNPQVPVRRLWPRIAAAASILLACSAGGYFLLKNKSQNLVVKPEAMLPTTQGVTLAVAGHQPIQIAYHHHGQLNAQVQQTDSLLAYAPAAATAEMQTLTNNSGHRITVQLADGTETVLDVASTLTYPSAFTGKERRVALNGQAYFKVKHDAAHPFYVNYAKETTEDVGTEFNIHAYADEPASTTLINGSIKVNSRLLKPGEQITNGHISVANLAEVTAWLQDQMILHHEKLENIMRNVARIYQVNVIWQYEQSKQFTFGGYVSRSKKLANVLNFMRGTGQVDFRVEGKNIYVIKPKEKK